MVEGIKWEICSFMRSSKQAIKWMWGTQYVFPRPETSDLVPTVSPLPILIIHSVISSSIDEVSTFKIQ